MASSKWPLYARSYCQPGIVDFLYAPSMPSAQSCNFAGIQYEQKLNKMLADAGIAFWTEEHLRDKGFFKTPDAKLQVPCVLQS